MPLPSFQFPPTSWPGGRYSFLLVALVLMFAVDPLVSDRMAARAVMDLFTVLVLFSGAAALGNRGIAWIIALCIIAPELIAMALGWSVDGQGSLGNGPAGTLRAAAAIAFFAYMAGVIFRDLVRGNNITGDAICGAMCVYLMLGLVWAFGYLLIAHFVPGSFEVSGQFVAVTSPDDSREVFALLTYFSFVTLTTLGFGDISPVSEIARTACWLEAITGQLFLATFVAGLVGVHIADRMEKRRSERDE